MADTTKGAVEIQRYTAENDPVGSYGHLEPDAAGECVMYDDHARIIATLAAENAALVADARRLDWLDRMNAALNARYGTTYRWRLILSPNIVRLMAGEHANGHIGDIDLNDANAGTGSHDGVRAAIDAALTRATEDAK